MNTQEHPIFKDLSLNDAFKTSVAKYDYKEFTNAVYYQLEKDEYSKFWYTLTHVLQQPYVNADYVKNEIKNVFVNKYKKIRDSDSIIGFLDGLSYFLTTQTRFDTQEVISMMSGYENSPFMETFKNKQLQNVDIFAKFRSTDHFQPYKNGISILMKKKESALLKKMFTYLSGLNSNNGELLKIFYQNNLYDYELIKDSITTYKLDINASGTVGEEDKTDASKTRWAFTHAVFKDPSAPGKKIFYEFIKDFGKDIDFESSFNYFVRNNNDSRYSYWNNYGVLTSMWEDPALSVAEKYKRSDAVLKNCNFTEKNLANITRFIFSEHLAFGYSQECYETLFNHPVFKSEKFDKDSLLTVLLNLDKDDSVKNTVKENNGVINPVTFVLDKMLKSCPDIKTDNHPFITWATDNKKFNEDTFKYLFNRYETSIRQLPASSFIDLPNSIKACLTQKGIDNLEKTSFFGRIFGSNNSPVNTPVQTKEVIAAYVPPESTLIFDNILLNRVGDLDVKKYIASIKLNAEQFEMVADNSVVSPSSHYMLNLLPKFLNKTVENYLEFQTLDEAEAKENVILQLKLLNKKTYEVLNDVLSTEKERIITKDKVQQKLMKQY